MIEKKFSIEIQTTPENVWYALWDSKYYSRWNAPLCEGAYILCDWEEDEKVFFLAPGGNGMASILKKAVLYKKAYFMHSCQMIKYEEQEEGVWTGAREQFTLKETNGTTQLKVLLDIPEEKLSFYTENYPKALQLLKSLAENLKIIIETNINSSLMAVWRLWNAPEHIKKWNISTDLWHVPSAENEVFEGGKFSIRIETKTGYLGYNFEGKYTTVKNLELLEYTFSDGRTGSVAFKQTSIGVLITEVFDPRPKENVFMEKTSRQLAMFNFQKYAEKYSISK